jgi:hypothetical protein
VIGILGLVDRDGYIVIANNGVVVVVPVIVTEPVVVMLLVIVLVGTNDDVNEPVSVPDILVDQLPVRVTVGVIESERVMETVGTLLDVTDIVLV